MNAMPVINPATVTDVFHARATEFLSMKKNAVAANMPIEIIQNVIPTKSSEANSTVSALAVVDKPISAAKTRSNIFSLFIKILSLIIFFIL